MCHREHCLHPTNAAELLNPRNSRAVQQVLQATVQLLTAALPDFLVRGAVALACSSSQLVCFRRAPSSGLMPNGLASGRSAAWSRPTFPQAED
jgi:hypothetical protein